MIHVSLFAGIGGIDLGAEANEIDTVLQCEKDPFCLAILQKHWPKCTKYKDIKKLNLFSFLEVSRSRMRVRQIQKERELMATEPDFGKICTGLFAKLDPNTYYWKTFQTSLIEDGVQSLQTFPKAAIIYGTELYLLKTSDSRLKGKGFTALLLRPVRSDGRRYNISKNALLKRYRGVKHCITLPEYLMGNFGVKHTPSFYEWMMGFPQGHTELPPSVTPYHPFLPK